MKCRECGSEMTYLGMGLEVELKKPKVKIKAGERSEVWKCPIHGPVVHFAWLEANPVKD